MKFLTLLAILALFAQYVPVAPSNSHIVQLLLYPAIQVDLPEKNDKEAFKDCYKAGI